MIIKIIFIILISVFTLISTIYLKFNKNLSKSVNQLNSEISNLKKELNATVEPEHKLIDVTKPNSIYEFNLTKNEKKLCGYLLKNLATKDIAKKMGKKRHSIEVARTRLRKKLGINNKKISISNYLSNIEDNTI